MKEFLFHVPLFIKNTNSEAHLTSLITCTFQNALTALIHNLSSPEINCEQVDKISLYHFE